MRNRLVGLRDGSPTAVPQLARKEETLQSKRQGLPSRCQYSSGELLQTWQHSWSLARAIVEEVQSDSRVDFEVLAGRSALIIPIEQVGGRIEMRGEPVYSGEIHNAGRHNSFTFVSEGDGALGHASPIKFIRLFTLEFDAPNIEMAFADTSYRSEALSSQYMVADDRILRLGQMLAEECTEPGPGGNLLADSLVLALLVKLLRRSQPNISMLSRGGLAPWQLRRAQEYMLDHISGPIILQALADITGVSRAHFSRAFKCSTGQSPYQWLILSRVEKAKSLLLEKSAPIAQISAALGFCDQAHLTRTFSKIVGATPLAWQRSRSA